MNPVRPHHTPLSTWSDGSGGSGNSAGAKTTTVFMNQIELFIGSTQDQDVYRRELGMYTSDLWSYLHDGIHKSQPKQWLVGLYSSHRMCNW